MTTRVLPQAEWHRLDSTGAGIPWRALDPTRNAVYVVEDDGCIVGTLVLMQAVHAEFAWIAPEHRCRASVPRRLRDVVLLAVQAPTVWMSSLSAQMNRIIAGLGGRAVPGDHHIVTLRTTSCLQP